MSEYGMPTEPTEPDDKEVADFLAAALGESFEDHLTSPQHLEGRRHASLELAVKYADGYEFKPERVLEIAGLFAEYLKGPSE